VGASVAIILNFNYIGVQLSAFGCGLFAVFAVVFISSVIAKGRLNLLVMVQQFTIHLTFPLSKQLLVILSKYQQFMEMLR